MSKLRFTKNDRDPAAFLKPLTYDQLLKYIRADNSLETELKLNSTSRTISDELKEALAQMILPNVADPANDYLYSTLWTIISKEANQMVGDLCLVGEPNANGEIAIGYGTYDEFQKNGFMTEAVGGMIEWAKAQPKVMADCFHRKSKLRFFFGIAQKQFYQNRGDRHLFPLETFSKMIDNKQTKIRYLALISMSEN